MLLLLLLPLRAKEKKEIVSLLSSDELYVIVANIIFEKSRVDRGRVSLDDRSS